MILNIKDIRKFKMYYFVYCLFRLRVRLRFVFDWGRSLLSWFVFLVDGERDRGQDIFFGTWCMAFLEYSFMNYVVVRLVGCRGVHVYRLIW